MHFDHRQAGRSLDSLDLFRTALQLAIPVAGLREIGRRMLFSVPAAKPDDHGRNHAFQDDEERRTWSLTPAFAVTFHEGMFGRGLRVNGQVWPRIEVGETKCREFGITKAELAQLLDGVRTGVGKWLSFAKSAGVPKDHIAAVAASHPRIGESVEQRRRSGMDPDQLPSGNTGQGSGGVVR